MAFEFESECGPAMTVYPEEQTMLKPGDCVMSGAQAVASMTAVDAHKPSEAKSLKAELLNLSIQASAQLDTCARTLQQMRTIIDDMSAQHTGKSKPRLAR